MLSLNTKIFSIFIVVKQYNRYTVLFLFIASLLLTSCEEEYKIDTSDFESSLVVNGLFTPNVPWSVSVTNSKNILDNSSDISVVEDAIVEIYNREGRHLYNLMLDEDGKFSNEDIAPSHGQYYSIKVSAAGYRSVIAQDRVPEQGKLTVSKTVISDKDGNIIDTEISFFIGKPDEDTYLVWELYDEEEIGEGGLEESQRNLTYSWLNQLYNNPRDIIKSGGVKVGKTINGNITTTLDKLLDMEGGGRGVVLNEVRDLEAYDVDNSYNSSDLGSAVMGGEDSGTSGEGGGEDGSDEDVEPKYELRVMTISKELHDYYNSIEKYYRYNPESVLIPPAKIHTNVKNGFGIFASYHEQVVTF